MEAASLQQQICTASTRLYQPCSEAPQGRVNSSPGFKCGLSPSSSISKRRRFSVSPFLNPNTSLQPPEQKTLTPVGILLPAVRCSSVTLTCASKLLSSVKSWAPTSSFSHGSKTRDFLTFLEELCCNKHFAEKNCKILFKASFSHFEIITVMLPPACSFYMQRHLPP